MFGTQLFTTYQELEQMITYNTNGRAKFSFFIDINDIPANEVIQKNPNELGLKLGRIPTMNDVQHFANATKEVANASFEYLYQPDKLNMVQYGWTSSTMSTRGGVSYDCKFWLKQDPSWILTTVSRKNDYPYTVLRSCDYIKGKGDNYTYLSDGGPDAYYNVRLVFDLVD